MHYLQVFEHQRVYCDEKQLTPTHLAALAQFNQLNGNRYFEVLHDGLRFKQYVGVVQIGLLNIEILPKLDRDVSDTAVWQQLLVDMLHHCQLIELKVLPSGQLHNSARQLLPLFVQVYLQEVEQLLKQGLLREYQSQEGPLPYWKGQIQFPQQQLLQMQKPQYCYSRYQDYSTQHIWYQLIVAALKVIKQLQLPAPLLQQTIKLLEQIPPQVAVQPTTMLFKQLRYSAKTLKYKRVMQLAELISLQHYPSIQTGRSPVLGLLFDMNQLFEEYVYQQLQRVCGAEWQLRRQESRVFWEQQQLRPDIVVAKGTQQWVMDIKWKVLEGLRPDAQDLRQLYVYQQQFGAQEGWLLYPARKRASSYVSEFGLNLLAKEQPAQRARLVWLPIINQQGKLNQHLGQELLALLMC